MNIRNACFANARLESQLQLDIAEAAFDRPEKFKHQLKNTEIINVKSETIA
jgi:hypothetical protein